MIPPLDERGLLPAGRHTATLDAVRERFANSSPRRAELWQKFMTFINNELSPWASGFELAIGGSYLSDKDAPDDIDATLLVPPPKVNAIHRNILDVGSALSRERLRGLYCVDFYVTLVGYGNDFSAFFEYVGEKNAAQRNLREKDPRGIVIVRLP